MMIGRLKARRAVITLATTALVVFAVLGLNPGMDARGTEPRGKSQHSMSTVLSYVPGQPLIVTIEHPYYDNNTLATYAEVDDVNGKPLFYLLPKGEVVGPNINKRGQATKHNRLIVAFDTTTLYASDPTKAGAPTLAFPGFGSGAILVVHTNENTDIPQPIAVEQVALTGM